MNVKLIALLLVTSFCFCLGGFLTVKVDAHEEECFYDDVQYSGQKVFFAYQVSQGGSLDVDVAIYNKNDDLVFDSVRESEGRVLFVAYLTGQYRFCFSNQMSSLTTKSVSFNIVIGDPMEQKPKKLDVTAAVDRSILRITEALTEIRQEQTHLRIRERVHRDTAESTNDRVMWGSIIQGAAMVGMSVLQIMYLKRCFEKRRNI
eukprot:RCo019454